MDSNKLISMSGKEIEGPILIKPKIFSDKRGFFMESWNQLTFNHLFDKPVKFVQDNHSHSLKGVIRGLHYQLQPYAQDKLVRCVEGKIFDIAVDLRLKSKTYGDWVGVELSSENHYQLWVPVGFAHGFYTQSDYAVVLYKTTAIWNRKYERSLNWADKDINIKWPQIAEYPILSEKDSSAPNLTNISSKDLFE